MRSRKNTNDGRRLELERMREERDEAKALAEKYLGALECANNTARRRGELNRELALALRKLRNEATGFLHFASPETHGWTNMRVLASKLAEVDKILAAHPYLFEGTDPTDRQNDGGKSQSPEQERK